MWLVLMCGKGCESGRTPHEVRPDWVRVTAPGSRHIDMGMREVTAREYSDFVRWIAESGDHSRCDGREGPRRSHAPRGIRAEFMADPESPVSGVDWYDAVAYCRWRGVRLPTRAEWMRAREAPAATTSLLSGRNRRTRKDAANPWLQTLGHHEKAQVCGVRTIDSCLVRPPGIKERFAILEVDVRIPFCAQLCDQRLLEIA